MAETAAAPAPALLEALWLQALVVRASMCAEAVMLRWQPVSMQPAQVEMSLSRAVEAFALALLAAPVLLVRVVACHLVVAAQLLLGIAAWSRSPRAGPVVAARGMWRCQAVVAPARTELWCVLVMLALLLREGTSRYAVVDAVLRPAAMRVVT